MNWKRIVIAAICSELLLAVIYVPLMRNDSPALPMVSMISMPVIMFLAGFGLSAEVSHAIFFMDCLLHLSPILSGTLWLH